MICLGWYGDLPYGDPGVPRLTDCRGALSGSLRSSVAEYLRWGIVVSEIPGAMAVDRLGRQPVELGPVRIMTDGVLVYPSSSDYWVERYGAAVPKAAIEHMQKLDWVQARPSIADIERIATEVAKRDNRLTS